jgi:hypothetical protein
VSQDLINLGIAIVGATVGWFLKIIWNSIQELQIAIRDLEKEVHTEYVSKEDYREDIKEVKDILHQIFDKLDNKADKSRA